MRGATRVALRAQRNFLDLEPDGTQSLRESPVRSGRPDCQQPPLAQRVARRRQARSTVEPLVFRPRQGFGAIVDIEHDRVEASGLSAQKLRDIERADRHARIAKWMLRELAEHAVAPRHHRGDELRDDHLRIGAELRERSRERITHTEPTDEHAHARAIADAFTGKRAERLFRSMRPAVHQLAARESDRELGAASVETQLRARFANRGCVEQLPGNHDSIRSLPI